MICCLEYHGPINYNARPRGTQREYSSKPHKHSIVERTLVFKH